MQINEAAVEAAFATFVAQNQDFAEYNTVPNMTVLAEYVCNEWGAESGSNASSWEIAFRVHKDKMIPNPDYISEANKRRIDGMSSAEVRSAMRDPNFSELWRRYSVATVPLESISNDPYVALDAKGYNAIPPIERARLYAQSYEFRRATEKLIQEGVI